MLYPCHAVVIAMKVNNGHQRFFIGHTDKVIICFLVFFLHETFLSDVQERFSFSPVDRIAYNLPLLT